MNLNLVTRFVLTGLLLAGLQACGSGGTDSAVGADVANYIDSNKNGVKDAGEVFDANHNGVDDDVEGLAGDKDRNGVLEGNERKDAYDANHNEIADADEGLAGDKNHNGHLEGDELLEGKESNESNESHELKKG
ncbi:MAG: hypothetical protein Q7T07_20275 [Burkholderiaceae bacterium]|nr:hypothetical protein [Burkholderiaceae bacterium]